MTALSPGDPLRLAADDSCAQASLVVGEALSGTAPTAEVWLLLELPGIWAPDPLQSIGLPEELRQRLRHWLQRIPCSRLQLVRQGHRRQLHRRQDGAVRFWLVQSIPGRSWCLEFALASFDELLQLDVEAAWVDGAHPLAAVTTAPMVLVCTHGQRDRCCARLGIPVYRALAQLDAANVWETSHVGGHRFAANVLSLPDGYCWGRVEPSEAAALLAAHQRGELWELAKLRGRSSYSAEVQAAECELRRRLDEHGIAALHLLDSTSLGADQWRVRFADASDTPHEVLVAAQPLATARPASCGDRPASARNFLVLP